MADFAPVDINNIQLDPAPAAGGDGAANSNFKPVDINKIKLDAPKGEDAGAGAAFGEGMANAVPGGQKITSAMGAAIAKLNPKEERSYSQLYKEAQANTDATSEAHPYAAGAGTATGVLSSLPIANAAAGKIGALTDAIPGGKAATAYLSKLGTPSEGAGMLEKAANLGIRSAKSAAVAAPAGAVYGAANAGPNESVGEGAVSGAETAAKIGAALPVAGAAAAAAYGRVAGAVNPLIDKAANSILRRSAEANGDVPPAVLDTAMGKVIKRLRADYPDEAQFNAALQKYVDTKDVGLAETAGSNTKNLAEGAGMYPSGASEAEGYFANRVGGSKQRIIKTFADQVSSNKDYYGTLDDIVEKGRDAAKPLYDRAYEANKAVVSPEIDKILETPAGKQALGIARQKMMNDRSLMGLPDKELGEIARDAHAMGKLAEYPQGGVAAGLNLRSLDYVKRALDDQIGAAYRAGENDNGRILTGLKNGLLDAMDEADSTGTYAKAREVSGDYLKNKAAMDNGLNYTKLGAPEEIKAHFDNLGPTEKESFKAGMVRAIKNKMDAAGDNYDLYKQVFGSQLKRDSIAAVLNPSEFSVLERNMTAEKNLFEFKNQMLGNSRTALRTISADEFKSGGQQIYQDLLQNGTPTRTAIKAATKWVGSVFDGLSDKTAGNVAKILYETDPSKKLEIMKALQGSSALPEGEKTIAMKAYFSIDKLFKKLSTKPLAKLVGSATGGNSDETTTQ